MISNTLPQSLIDNPILSQWIAFEEPGRVRRRHRQGRDRPGHPHRADADRRRRARRPAGADQSRLRPDRHQPGRRLHLGQLFDRGRRRLHPAGLRRGALAVPRPRRRDRLRCPVERAFHRGRQVPARAANTPAATTGRWPATSTSTGAPAAPRRPSGPRPTRSSASILPRLDLPAKVAGAGFIHDIAPENVLHARVLRQPWRGAHLAALDESAVRKAAEAPIEYLARGRIRRLHRPRARSR